MTKDSETPEAPEDQPDQKPDPESEKDDKGSGPSIPASSILVTFPAPGYGDPSSITPTNTTPGQLITAGFYLLSRALWEAFAQFNLQEAQQRREAAEMESILRATSMPTKD